MKRFLYQALLVSTLLKDKGLYELEVSPLSDGLILYSSDCSPVAYFYYLGDGAYRFKEWNRERGWVTTSCYGTINQLVALLAEKYRTRCKSSSLLQRPYTLGGLCITMERYECDLHCHTTRSDGNDTPEELVERAASIGMKVVAITDHDVPPPTVFHDGEEMDSREYAREKGVELLLGYEFSTDTYVDDVHIIGYDLDWSHPQLLQEVNRAKKSKSEAYRVLCELLTEKGMYLSFEEDILQYRDGEGNVRTRKKDEVERKFIFEAMAQKGYAPSWEKAKIMVRDDPSLNIRREKIDPHYAIELIHTCGGLAVLAHPYLIDEHVYVDGTMKLTREEYIEGLIKGGLDGIEARYTYDKTSYKGDMTVEEIEREVRERYRGRLAISGGSDYHGEGKKGKKNPREIGEAGLSFSEFQKGFGHRMAY